MYERAPTEMAWPVKAGMDAAMTRSSLRAVRTRRVRARQRRALVLARLLLLALAAVPLAVYVGADPPATAPYSAVERQLQAAAAATLKRNVYTRVPVVYPSPAYYNPYLRDSFWAAQALGDRRFSLRVLGTFAAAERPDGDPPAMFVNAYRHARYYDDESAALLLIWAWRNQVLYGTAPPRTELQRALDYLLRRAPGGFLLTPAGANGGWLDAYHLPAEDVLAYSQGLYAVALRCAQHLGLTLPAEALTAAENGYRALYDPRRGYVRFSLRVPASDASALTGEFLSLWLFHQPILSDTMVFSTLRCLPAFGAGFRDVALPTGQSLASAATAGLLGAPGDYQNGGSWLLYDALSIGAAGLHGEPDALQRLRARLALEFRHGAVLREYLQTAPTLPYYGSEPADRDYFSWDAFVVVIDRVLHERLGG